MITIDEAGDMLDEIAESLPKEFYKHLNGGIILFPEAKAHPESVGADLYILGEYHNERSLGRYIIIYYGSFIRVHRGLEREAAKQELRRILLHEFTHHLESLAGEKDLEIQDAIDIAKYKNRHRINPPRPEEIKRCEK